MSNADKINVVFDIVWSLFEKNKEFFNEMMSFVPYNESKMVGNIQLSHEDVKIGSVLRIIETIEGVDDDYAFEFSISNVRGTLIVDEYENDTEMWNTVTGLRERTAYEDLHQIYEFFRIIDVIQVNWKR